MSSLGWAVRALAEELILLSLWMATAIITVEFAPNRIWSFIGGSLAGMALTTLSEVVME